MRDLTKSDLFQEQFLVYDWLEEKGHSWRVYYESFPFFMLMPKIAERFLGDVANRNSFRTLRWLKNDLLSPDPIPDVIFIEPSYYDAPHIATPDDNHPLAPIRGAISMESLRRRYMHIAAWKRFASQRTQYQ